MPDDFWEHEPLRSALAERHMGKVIHAYRRHPFHGRRAFSQEMVATWLSITQPQLSRIETGPPIAHLDRLVHCATVLGIPQHCLWFALPGTPCELGGRESWNWTAHRPPPAPQASELVAPGRDQVHDPISWRGAPANGSDSDMRRRDLLKLGGLVISGRVLDVLDFEPDRMRHALSTPSVNEDRLTYYEARADDLAKEVVQVPPTQLLDETTTLFSDVRTLIEERQRPRQQSRLMVVATKLATVVGEILFNVGDMSAAQQWYLTAIDASREVGHQYLGDLALAGMAYLPMYSDNPRGVLDVVTGRLEESPTPSPAVAWLWGAAARASATLGDKQGFESSIASCRETLEASDPELVHLGILSFTPAKQAFYEADGYARFNDLGRTACATGRALALYDESETMDPFLAKLDHAMCLVGAGETEEGCRIATEAITDPKTFIGHSICKWSDSFDEKLTGTTSPAVRDWRENYRLVTARATAKQEPAPVSEVPDPGVIIFV